MTTNLYEDEKLMARINYVVLLNQKEEFAKDVFHPIFFIVSITILD